jgi:hypothetical protein
MRLLANIRYGTDPRALNRKTQAAERFGSCQRVERRPGVFQVSGG